jgi:predicted DNA-binding transcriptional regulator AlpA
VGDDPRTKKILGIPIERFALRLDEVARAIGISRRALERERSAGRFPKPDITIGRMPLFRPETIRQWLEGGSQ